jgi:hypothetical protein
MVHGARAYADLAGLTQQKSESSFDYPTSVFGFWRSLCVNTRAAETVGPVTLDQHVTDYIIGDSFSAEILIMGAYERSVGAATALARGARTAEDDFALKVADDYAAFLEQTPCYQYPFFPTVGRFWRETPFGEGSFLRSAVSSWKMGRLGKITACPRRVAKSVAAPQYGVRSKPRASSK